MSTTDLCAIRNGCDLSSGRTMKLDYVAIAVIKIVISMQFNAGHTKNGKARQFCQQMGFAVCVQLGKWESRQQKEIRSTSTK